MPPKIRKTEKQWKAVLTPEQYSVLRKGETERPFTGKYNDHWEKGAYLCAGCNTPLFRSEAKYDHGTGWPSFSAPVDDQNLEFKEDYSLMMKRVEVRCASCGAHLGHVFDDGPEPTFLHYCINSTALSFVPEGQPMPERRESSEQPKKKAVRPPSAGARTKAKKVAVPVPEETAGLSEPEPQPIDSAKAPPEPEPVTPEPAPKSEEPTPSEPPPSGPALSSPSPREDELPPVESAAPAKEEAEMAEPSTARATFAAGCFWGVEYKMGKVPGVISTTVGYTGGSTPDPTYEQVCTDKTGHAEAVDIVFDPALIGYDQLVRHFFAIHDPTQVDRQGPDYGTQYRSAIFYHGEEQRKAAQKVKDELDASGKYRKPLATEIVPAQTFYRAEERHQKYFEKNGIVCY
jgi:peptide methionine sulfoxide reductase msrA/msrB